MNGPFWLTDFTERVLLGMGLNATQAKRVRALRAERLRRAYLAGVTLVFGTDIMVHVEGETRGRMAIDYTSYYS